MRQCTSVCLGRALTILGDLTMMRSSKKNTKDDTPYPKPFVKWAGGKTQLIAKIVSRLPAEILETRCIQHYVEPFVGGGALFYYLKNNFTVENAFLNDNNRELILIYLVIQQNVGKLIFKLENIETDYLKRNEEERKLFYYNIREKLNHQLAVFDFRKHNSNRIDRAAYLMFLNRTCFNGLFRQNKNGGFNVPFGRYKNPRICHPENLRAVSAALRHTKISCDDFASSAKIVRKGTLVYLDPPYRPLNQTSKFTSYSNVSFNDADQRRLAEFFRQMSRQGAWVLLSNSDPKNEDPTDSFFDQLYAGFQIERVAAKRLINSKSNKRGAISEILVRNY